MSILFFRGKDAKLAVSNNVNQWIQADFRSTSGHVFYLNIYISIYTYLYSRYYLYILYIVFNEKAPGRRLRTMWTNGFRRTSE